MRVHSVPASVGGISCRHFQGACGRGCAPVPKLMCGGEDCPSVASSAALTFGTEAKAPKGPRPGAHGFGSFCRNKRTSSCGAETPHDPLSTLPSFPMLLPDRVTHDSRTIRSFDFVHDASLPCLCGVEQSGSSLGSILWGVDPLVACESERSLLTMNGLCRGKLLYDYLSNSGKPVAG